MKYIVKKFISNILSLHADGIIFGLLYDPENQEENDLNLLKC